MTTSYVSTNSTFDHSTLDEIGLEGVRSMYDLPEIVALLLENSIKPTQSNYCQLEDDICPLCGHKGCFKIYHGDPDRQNYHCFSCGEWGDIFDFIVKMKLAKNPHDAANKLLRGELEGVTVITSPKPKMIMPETLELTSEQFDRRQALYLAAWEYYVEPMFEDRSTPLQSLMDKRKLSQNILIEYDVGYSRGALWRYLIEHGFTLEEMYASGLVKESPQSPYDFFPKGVYIFPHYDETGAICRFTFKDPEKKVAYQLSKLFWLNNIQFYGQHTMNRQGTVAVVEGEFDLLALMDHGWQGPVIATNGQISQAQLAWIKENLHDRNVVTFFDSDPAGDKYREKLVQLGLPALVQVTLPEGQGKDIDDYLRQDNALSIEVLVEQYGVVAAQASIETTSEPMQDESLASHQQTDESEQLNSSDYDVFDEDTLNDVGNADRLAAYADGALVYVPEHSSMFAFNGRRWGTIGEQELAYARCIGEMIIAQANRMLEDPATLKCSGLHT